MVNKSSPEYLRVREDLIEILKDEDLAESILAIQGLAILTDDQYKPINHWGNLYGLAQHDREVVNFKKVV